MNKNILVVTDLDGTLLDDNKKISPYTVQYFQKLQEKGVKIVLASGRPYRSIKAYYQQLGLNTLVICYNGGVIIDPQQNEKVVFAKDFPTSVIKRMIQGVGVENFENIMVEDMKNLYLEYDNDCMEDFCYKKGMNVVYSNIVSKLGEHSLGAVFCLKDHTNYFKLLSLAKDKNYPDIGLRYWENSLVGELYFKNLNKYTSLQKVAELYQVDNKDIICFGDADNDIEMLYRSGVGVSMKNATSKEVALKSHMASLEDNNHDGVAKTLELLLANI